MESIILFKTATILSHDDDEQHVNILRNTDLLVRGNKIIQIGLSIDPPQSSPDVSVTTVDCTDKIISPGFTDTHQHLWQTQLKGRHIDETLLDYFVSGNIQSNNYDAEDIFWGQLAGAMEVVDAGTTFVLDHAHCCLTRDMANQALAATVTSGIRSVFAYSKPGMRFEKWDKTQIIPSSDGPGGQDLALDHIEELARKAGGFGNGRIRIGMGFDSYYLPEEVVKGVFKRVMDAGVEVVTSHTVNVPVFDSFASTVQTLHAYNLFPPTTPSLVLSHCTNLPQSDLSLLRAHSIPISCTPETEAQMALGDPLIFSHDHHGHDDNHKLNISLGVDCHTNNTSFMPALARTALYCARLTTNSSLLHSSPTPKYPRTLPGSTEEAFNAMTIMGAKAVGRAHEFGSLRVGKLADLVVFDVAQSLGMSCVAESDPMGAIVRFSDRGDVWGVLVDGVVRKWEGKMVGVRRTGEVLETEEGRKDEQEEMSWNDVRRELVKSMKKIVKRDEECSYDVAREYVMMVMGGKEERLA